MAVGLNNFSIWCDFIERDFLESGLPELIDSGVVSGVTSNPVIFKNAIVNSSAYIEDKNKDIDLSPAERYEMIAVEDIKRAAILLLPTYNANENDGFVSIEVNPNFSNDAKKMTLEAKRLYKAINMPNIMIKIPATTEGYETVKDLIIDGINVNATLVFSPMQAGKCLQAIENGFYMFQRKNPKKNFPHAVISVFVSRFDRKLDAILEVNGMDKMKFGIMNASYIHQIIKEKKIPNVRCLFASTGVSDKGVKDSYYITKLLYDNTINTAPLKAIESFIDILDIDERACPSKETIQEYFNEVESKGVNLKNIYSALLNEGLEQFNAAFEEMIDSFSVVDEKRLYKEDTSKTIQKNVISDVETANKESLDKDDIRVKVDVKSNKQAAVKKEVFEKPKKQLAIDSSVDNEIYAISLLKECLKTLISFHGSDLHIKSDVSVKGRVNGEIITINNDIFTKADMEILAEELLQSRYEEFSEKKNIDFIYKLDKDYRFRVNIFHQTDGISAAFRAIPLKLPTVELMDLPEVIKEFAEKRRGLVLVTGPTGCGKSTTIATIINLINQTSQKHIITIEDPIEFIYEDDQSIINQRSIGQDAISFADALTASLREDPDVIMVGEMRDLETVRTAVRAAETGHLVFSTLHTLDAKETIGRIINMFSGNEQSQIRKSLSSVLVAVISQRLVVRKKGNGRVAALEILIKNARVEDLIAQCREHEIKDAIEGDRDIYHSQSFNQALLDLYEKGTISYNEALYAATSPSDLKILLDNYDVKKAKEQKEVHIYPNGNKDKQQNVAIDLDDNDILDLKS